MTSIKAADALNLVVINWALRQHVKGYTDSKKRLDSFVRSNKDVIVKNSKLMDELRKVKR